MPESTEGLLAQILQEQIATRRDIADLRVDLATHGETSRNLLALGQDHETRIRALESEDVVTSSELAARDERASTQRRWLVGLLGTLTTFVIGEAVLLALWLLDR